MIQNLFAWFWIVMILLSIAWYVVFLFLVGFKGGCEIHKMTQYLSRQMEDGKNRVESD